MTDANPVERALIKTLILAAALAIACAGLAISLIAVSRSSDSISCVNRILGTRQDITAKDSAAQSAEADAEAAFTNAVNAIFSAPPDSPEQAAAYINFQKVSIQSGATLKQSAATLKADQEYRTANPLGHC